MGMYMYVFGSAHMLHDMSVSVFDQVDITGDMSTSGVTRGGGGGGGLTPPPPLCQVLKKEHRWQY
jgi:hypothetical protein